MTDDEERPPDWAIDLSRGPDRPSPEVEGILRRGSEAMDALRTQLAATRAASAAVESLVLEASEAGAERDVIADRLGITLSAVDAVARGDGKLVPDLM